MTFMLDISNELLTRLQLLLLVVMTTVMLKSTFNSHLPVISYLTYVVRSHFNNSTNVAVRQFAEVKYVGLSIGLCTSSVSMSVLSWL